MGAGTEGTSPLGDAIGSAEWSYTSAILEGSPSHVPLNEVHAIGPFAVEATLGQGGMGRVLQVRYRGRSYALKLILKDTQSARERLEREARLVGALEHPNIVRLHGAGEVAGHEFLLYDLVLDGRPLQLEGLSVAERVERIAQVADAVGHAHELGIVHRDLKPGNVLLDSDGNVRVIDFGLGTHAKLDRLTQTGALVGTPRYMAPEQFNADPSKQTPAIDVWSLGVMLYEALTSQLPFQAKTTLEQAVIVARKRPQPPSKLNPEVSRALDRVCLKALSPDQEERHPDARSFADALREALAAPQTASRWRWVATGVVALGVLTGALIVWLPTPPQPEPAHSTPPAPSDLSAPFELLETQALDGAELLNLARDRLQAKPADLEAQAAEAAALLELRDHVGASAVAKSVLQQAPANLVALRALAGSLYTLGDLPEALRVCERALAIDPDAEFALIYGCYLEVAQLNPSRALELASRAVDLRPDHPEALAARGAALHASRQYPEALADLNAALASKELPNVRLNRANVYLKLNRPVPALEDLEGCKEPLGETQLWYATHVLCLLQLQPADAEREARAAVARRPEQADMHYLLGEALRLQGKPEEARPNYKRAVELEPDSQWGRAAAGKLKRLGR